MAATSKHYLDIYNWILKVIKTSNPLKDLNAVNKLIDNYRVFLENNSNLEYEYRSMLLRNLQIEHAVRTHEDPKEI